MNISSINADDLAFCPYSDHSSQPLPTLSPSVSFFDGVSINPNLKLTDDLRHDHPLDFSSFPPSEFDPDSLFAVFLRPAGNDGDENETIRQQHLRLHHPHPSFDLLLLNNTALEDDPRVGALETISHMENSKKLSNSQDPNRSSKKKSTKSDRHSKICTAKGLRDRRMRLSLDVAKEFFGLQDMLGFDKASRTVEWLLTQAKPEIKKLARSLHPRLHNDSSSNEDQTHAYGWIDERGNEINNDQGNKIGVKSEKAKKKRSESSSRPLFKKLPKDARLKARQRAKERTMQKMMKKQSLIKASDVEAVKYWSCEESVQEIEELSSSHGFIAVNGTSMNREDDNLRQESLDIINRCWNPFLIFNHHPTNGPAASIQHQQLEGKPRTAVHNTQSLC